MFRVVTLKCLTEVACIPLKTDAYDEKLKEMFCATMREVVDYRLNCGVFVIVVP